MTVYEESKRDYHGSKIILWLWSSTVHKCHYFTVQTPTTDSPITVQFTPYDDPRTLCIYDWELATVDVPQHDLAEFLAFTLEPTTPLKTRLELMEFYLQHLQYYSGMEYPWER